MLLLQNFTLGKLWNLSLKGCSLRDPLKSMVHVESYKTVDLIAYLKSVLEEYAFISNWSSFCSLFHLRLIIKSRV